MKGRGAIALLILLAFSIPPLTSQRITARIEPPFLDAVPGQSVNMRLVVRNLGTSEVKVTGLRVFITSEEIFLLPVRADFGEYQIPFDEPTTVPPGGEVIIHKAIEVPNVPVFGRFLLRVRVETTGGIAYSQLRVRLRHSPTSLGVFAFLILLAVLLIYAAYRIVRGRLSAAGRFRRRIERIDVLLAEKRRILELMRRLEERRGEGKVGESEYRRLREEYRRSLEEVQSRLNPHLESLKSMLSSIEDEISRLREEMSVIRARMEVGELSKGEGRRLLGERDSIIRSLDERADILRERIREIEAGTE